MSRSTYLDHAATSPIREAAREELVRHLGLVGNPSALHRAGQRARRVLEEARERLAAAVGAHPTEVVFTSGGSEANSIALIGGLAARRDGGRNRVLVSAVEHPAGLQMTTRGAEVIPVLGDGRVDVAAALDLLRDDVAVCSVMTVNNETGIAQPVDEVREAAAEVGAWFHSDAVQALGHLPLDFAASGADMMTLSAHKAGGPVGIGALLVRRDVTPSPIGLGGGQEREIRSGTAAAALAAAFAVATQEAVAELDDEAPRLRELQAQISRMCEALGGRVNSELAPSAPHIVNVTFPGVRADDVLFLLDRAGIHASVGSACRAGVHQPSEVLLAMGSSADDAAATLRFSLGHTSGSADVEHLAEVLPAAVAQARGAAAAG